MFKQASLRSAIAVVLCLLTSANAAAQRNTFGQRNKQSRSGVGKAKSTKRTTLTFEIITPLRTSSRVGAQEWGRVFSKLGYTVRIRAQKAGDGGGPAEAVAQTETATSRRIKVVGLLDQRNRLRIGTDQFRTIDDKKLKEWIDTLKKYGKAGDPTGQPLWGLSRDQFNTVFDSIKQPLRTEVFDLPLEQAVKRIQVPAQFQIEWSDGAKLAAKGRKVTRRVQLYGTATALALILNDAGLGFFPQRQPDGSVKLRVVKRGRQDLWPVGWPPKLSVNQTLPNFYKKIPVGLPKVSLKRVFEAIEKRAKLTIFVDEFHIDAKGYEYDKMQVEVKRTQLSWSTVIRRATAPNRLSYDVRVDELGKPFIFISATDIIRARKDRFEPKTK